jgi:hypothetical protein
MVAPSWLLGAFISDCSKSTVTVFEVERDEPRSIHMDRLARRLTQDARLHLSISLACASFSPKGGKTSCNYFD